MHPNCGSTLDPQSTLRGDFALPAGSGIVTPRSGIRAILAITMVEVGASTTGTEVSFRMPEKGIVTEIFLGALAKTDQELIRSSLKLKITLPQNTEAICRDESGSAFVPFAAFYDGDQPAPFYRVCDKDDRLVFQVKNDSSIAYTPLISLRFLPLR